MSATMTEPADAATTLTQAKVAETQAALRDLNLAGWLLYDFHGYNKVAVEYLGLSGVVTRRSFYFIPAEGEPVGFVHKIEEDKFADLPGARTTYSSYKVLEESLRSTLLEAAPAGAKIAMEYSPMGRLPYIGIVDAGTVELIRSFGLEVVSSADLVAQLQAALNEERRGYHLQAAKINMRIKDEAFDFIRRKLAAGEKLTEYEVAKFITDRYDAEGMIYDHYPIVAVDAWAGNPHYEPLPEKSNEIKNGSLILIDMWCRSGETGGVYSDICWMAYANGPGFEEPPALYVKLFGYVLQAQQAAVDYLSENFSKGPVYGADADDAARKVIAEAGYGQYFTHRTGHSITGDVHGSGPNIDNLETEDK
ncbi:MAG TPA: M24 family metallopeptidase, partial [candidate division Zixibacteria bacterium]|nr:M24 family metallopeptidase [candidate division Zixibacteria bacterium]